MHLNAHKSNVFLHKEQNAKRLDKIEVLCSQPFMCQLKLTYHFEERREKTDYSACIWRTSIIQSFCNRTSCISLAHVKCCRQRQLVTCCKFTVTFYHKCFCCIGTSGNLIQHKLLIFQKFIFWEECANSCLCVLETISEESDFNWRECPVLVW